MPTAVSNIRSSGGEGFCRWCRRVFASVEAAFNKKKPGKNRVDVGVEFEGLVYGDPTVCYRSVSLRLLVLARVRSEPVKCPQQSVT